MFVEWLDGRLPIAGVLLLFPIIFMFHDFEEILTVEKWARVNEERVFQKLPKRLHQFFRSSFRMNTLEFAMNVFWIFLAIVLATFLAVFMEFYFIFLVFLALFFFHVFTHLGQAILLKTYTPGVITSILIVLPYSIYTYYRLLLDGKVQGETIIWSIVTMLVLLPFGLLLLISARNRADKNNNQKM